VFLAEIGKRVAEGRRHTAEVLQTIPADQPDLFAAASSNTLLKRSANARCLATWSNLRASGVGR